MRSLLLLVAAGAIAIPARAQTPRVARAFERAATPWIGLRNFGGRAFSPLNGNASYSPSLAVGAMFDRPLGRRTGVVLDVHVAPLARQELSDDESSARFSRVFAYGATAALAGRFRPQAPIFFFGGATILGATKRAIPGEDGGAFSPGATLGAGLDLARSARVGARIVYQAYFVKPPDTDAIGYRAESRATDWTLGIGARIALGRAGEATR
jgi:hypothetical protein